MQTGGANNEPPPDQGNRKVMGESEHLQTDSSGRNTADSLGMSDLQRSSVDQQSELEQNNKLKSLTDAFDTELEDLRRWERKERRLDEAFDKALERMKILEDRQALVEKQQHDFTISSRANFKSEQPDGADSSIAQTATDNLLKQVAESLV